MLKRCRPPMNLLAGLAILLFLFMANAGSVENVLSLERMGAGVPGGWKLEQERCSWTPLPEPGPLGVGAARIRFDGEGTLSLSSPAKALPAGKRFAAALWVRSEPAGATLSFAVRDNEDEKPLALQKNAVAPAEWQCLLTGGDSAAFRNRALLF